MTRFPVDGTGRLSSEVEHPSAALTGPAGGDLSGSFPNPAVATVNGQPASSVVNDGSATPKDIDSTGVTDANSLLYDGSGGKFKPGAVVRVVAAPFLSLRDFNPHANSDLAGGGTDDSPVFAAALAAMPTLPSFSGDVSRDRGRTLVIPEGSYRLSSSINLDMSCTRLLGESGSGWHGSTKLVADAGVTAININQGWITLEDIDVMGNDVAPGTNDGIFCKGHGPTLRNVDVDGFFGRDGIHIDTDGGGNANNWLLDHVRSCENWRHGLYISGGDTNAGTCQGSCDFNTNRAWQVFDHSFLGNSFLGTHVSGAFGASFGAYPVATTLNGPIGSTDTSIVVTSGAALDNPDALSAGYIVVGAEWISYGWITGNTLNGCKRGRRGTTAASHLTAANVTQGYGGYWTRTAASAGSMFYGCYAEDDSPSLINNPSMIFGGVISFGTDGTGPTFGPAGSGLRLLPGGDSLASITWGSAAPVAGTWTQGSIVYALAPAAGGNIGWVCTTAGTPGTWKTFGAIAA